MDPRLWTAPRRSRSGSSQRLDQTAREGQSRFALAEHDDGQGFAGAPETLALPATALQNDRRTLQEAGPVGSPLDARAASGRGLLLAVAQLGNAEPGRGLLQSNEVGNAGAQGHHGIDVPNVGFLAASLAALVPGVPPLGK